MSGKINDSEILYALKNRTERVNEILNHIYRKDKNAVIQLVMNNNGNKEEALDVFQDAVIALYENVRSGKFKGESSISSYLYAICKYSWLNKLKRKGLDEKYKKIEITTNETRYHDHSIDLLEKEKLIVINSIFEKLGEKCKQILTYSLYHEYSMKEISNMMDYQNEQVARNKKSNCNKKLQELIKENKGVQQLLQEIK